MTDYPVTVEVSSPQQFDRIQLLLRVVLAIALAWFGMTAGWLICVLYGALPVIAAIAISSQSSAKYAQDVAPRLWKLLEWLLQFSAYMMMIVDRVPTGGDFPGKIELRITGTPTAGSALARLATSLPSGFVLMLLWLGSGVAWVVAAVFVLVGAPMPPSILAFQRGVLRWQARLVAYHASLVEEYPPFALDTGGDFAVAAR